MSQHATQASSETIIQQVMNEPQVLAIGLVAGFVLAKALAWRNKRNQFP